MATLNLSAVRKLYPNGAEAVKGLTFDIADGQLCVLVGPSGCGKSTLLRMIAGLESVTEGEVRIDGARVNDIGPAERDIAMVFQNYALYPHMKVYDNMAYGLRNRGMGKGEIDTRVREAAARLELAHLLDRKPSELSGGQRQRVAMGRAIVRDPKVFLFDEPLSNLDAKLRGQMRVEIKNLQRSLGVTSVYVTHDQLEAMTLADVLVVMNAGEIEQIGAPLDVYEAPASTFVASFIGAPSMNLLPLASGAFAGVRGVPANAVTIGFRPEDAEVIVAAGASTSDLTLDAIVEAVEPVGAESFIYARAGGDRIILRVAGRTQAAPDDAWVIRVPAHKIHAFGTDGRRLQERM
ncbi:ABC transporter ATP-binding protein [Agaricicola taiwanensis]|uniref:ABC transporter ATP-binding protein n=1 Tax=Agaricicola taiwanensis TaxID=591372 RepID=A0A8J2VK03_9RHOB|nr:sn-glycerol-3-phosphate ABC transporter ATP-binding protein UgpC [Agaricicola taiwanensis]GGE28484.1 ABC transporter ATP-binding protein [Agaricicola taiwanensis]